MAMAMATIRVSRETQDLLNEIATRVAKPKYVITEDALREYLRMLRWKETEVAFARLADDEEANRDYHEEAAAWDATLMDGIDPADEVLEARR